MTRDEAVKVFCSGYATFNKECAAFRLDDANRFIDLCVALGMLKLDEPKSVEAKFRDAFYEMFPDPLMLRTVRMCVDRAGLKIVEK